MDDKLKSEIIKTIKDAAAAIPEYVDEQFEMNINIAVKKILSAHRMANIKKTSVTFRSKRFKKLQHNNTSGARGVTFNKNANKWQAKIGNGTFKTKHLGYFDSMAEAAAARAQAEVERWGERF